MIDTTTIILTAVCTGIGISIGNALYDLFLRDYFTKLKKKKKKIHKNIQGKKLPWLAGLLNFFIWGLGYIYNGKKRILGISLLLIQLFILATLSFSAANVEGSYETLNYSFFTFLVSSFLAYDSYRRAKEINENNMKNSKTILKS